MEWDVVDTIFFKDRNTKFCLKTGIEKIVRLKLCFREMVSIWRQQMETGTAYEKLQE